MCQELGTGRVSWVFLAPTQDGNLFWPQSGTSGGESCHCVPSTQVVSNPGEVGGQWDTAVTPLPSLALHRAPGPCLPGSYAPRSSGGPRGGLCPHYLCCAGPAVLGMHEGAEVSWGRLGSWSGGIPSCTCPCGLEEGRHLPQEARPTTLPPSSACLSQASSSFAEWRRIGFPRS